MARTPWRPVRSGDLRAGAHLLRQLPALVRRPIAMEDARAELARRLESRAASFLALVGRAVYGAADSPYRTLLVHAGCTREDLERMVAADGVEGALHTLYRHGVYLTIDELRGRRPVRRGTTTLNLHPGAFVNAGATAHVAGGTGGSRSTPLAVGFGLDHLRDVAVDFGLALDARGGLGWTQALWTVPGGAALHGLLSRCAIGAAPARWFSQVDPDDPRLDPRYRRSAAAVRWAAVLGGVRLPGPVYVPVDDPLPIVRWLADTVRAGRVPHLTTFASSAVRLCEAARAAGIDIAAARLTLTGEPTTRARLETVQAAGVQAVPGYGSGETASVIAHGCLAPDEPDDLHLAHDLHAVIQPGRDATGAPLPPSALLFSSLRPHAPLILLNVSLGDAAVLTRRACGCRLERLGWATHLHTIRSFQKLTAGGMTFLDADLAQALEVALPRRFGGGSTDYQLIEEESPAGRPRLRLRVHPAVGPLDADAVVDAFLAAIGPGEGAERVMALAWREAGFLTVERRPPEHTIRGKILHLHSRDRRVTGELVSSSRG